MSDWRTLPDGLPIPEDDGAADHLSGLPLPPLAFPATTGGAIDLAEAADGTDTLVLYLYPLTGRPGVGSPAGWDEIPGAWGCTREACSFRDHHAELLAAGARVAGLSAQTTDYQREAAGLLALPYPLLADPELRLAASLRLPTFTAEGQGRLYKRLTLIARTGAIVKAFYPVISPGAHALEVTGWLREQSGPPPQATGE